MDQEDDDDEVKGQKLVRMDFIVNRIEGDLYLLKNLASISRNFTVNVKRIEVELNHLKNLIIRQIEGLTASSSTNCDRNPDSDGNCDTSIKLKTQDSVGVPTYQEKFNKDQEQEVQISQNRPTNVDEELILEEKNFNFKVPSKNHHGNPQVSFLPTPQDQDVQNLMTLKDSQLILQRIPLPKYDNDTAGSFNIKLDPIASFVRQDRRKILKLQMERNSLFSAMRPSIDSIVPDTYYTNRPDPKRNISGLLSRRKPSRCLDRKYRYMTKPERRAKLKLRIERKMKKDLEELD